MAWDIGADEYVASGTGLSQTVTDNVGVSDGGATGALGSLGVSATDGTTVTVTDSAPQAWFDFYATSVSEPPVTLSESEPLGTISGGDLTQEVSEDPVTVSDGGAVGALGSLAVSVTDETTVTVTDAAPTAYFDSWATSKSETAVSVTDSTPQGYFDSYAVNVTDPTTVTVSDGGAVGALGSLAVSVTDSTTVSVSDGGAVGEPSTPGAPLSATVSDPQGRKISVTDSQPVGALSPAPTAWRFIGSAMGAPAANPGDGTFTVHASTLAGDLVVAHWYSRAGAKTFTAPAGVGVTSEIDAATANGGHIWVGWWIAASASDSKQWTGGDVSNGTTGWGTAVFRGGPTSLPFRAKAVVAGGSDSAPNPPSVATWAGECVICGFGHMDDYTAASYAVPSNFTDGGNWESTLGTDACGGLAYDLDGGTGSAVDPGTFTNMAGDQYWYAWSASLRATGLTVGEPTITVAESVPVAEFGAVGLTGQVTDGTTVTVSDGGATGALGSLAVQATDPTTVSVSDGGATGALGSLATSVSEPPVTLSESTPLGTLEPPAPYSVLVTDPTTVTVTDGGATGALGSLAVEATDPTTVTVTDGGATGALGSLARAVTDDTTVTVSDGGAVGEATSLALTQTVTDGTTVTVSDGGATGQPGSWATEVSEPPVSVTDSTPVAWFDSYATTVSEPAVTVSDPPPQGWFDFYEVAVSDDVTVSDETPQGTLAIGTDVWTSVSDTVTVSEVQWRPIVVTDVFVGGTLTDVSSYSVEVSDDAVTVTDTGPVGTFGSLGTTVSEPAVTVSEEAPQGSLAIPPDLSQTVQDTVSVYEVQWRPIVVTDVFVGGTLTDSTGWTTTVSETAVTVTESTPLGTLNPAPFGVQVTELPVTLSEYVHTDLYGYILVTDSAPLTWFNFWATTVAETTVTVTDSAVGEVSNEFLAVEVSDDITVTESTPVGNLGLTIEVSESPVTLSESEPTGEFSLVVVVHDDVSVTDGGATGALGSWAVSVLDPVSVSDGGATGQPGAWATTVSETAVTVTDEAWGVLSSDEALAVRVTDTVGVTETLTVPPGIEPSAATWAGPFVDRTWAAPALDRTWAGPFVDRAWQAKKKGR